MMSHARHATFNMMAGRQQQHFVNFENFFGKQTGHFTSNLGSNMIEHVSRMELYIILSTLEKVGMLESDNFNHEISAQ